MFAILEAKRAGLLAKTHWVNNLLSGVIIWVGQWKDFFGLSPETGAEHFHEKL